ncbi:MAG: hypothetical protein ACYC0V_01555 [Armatimonadota bacterium]
MLTHCVYIDNTQARKEIRKRAFGRLDTIPLPPEDGSLLVYLMKKPRRRVVRVIGIVVLVIIIVLAVVPVFRTPILARKLEAKIAEIKSQGAPVSMLEFGKDATPDSQNAASVYLKIFEKIGRPIIYENGVPREVNKNKATPGWMAFYLARTNDKRTPEMWKNARKSIASYPDVSALVDKAISMPHCKFKTNWKDSPGTLFPYHQCIRELSRIIHTKAIIDAKDGNMDSAVKNTCRIFGISKSIRNEPVLVGQLVRIAVIGIGARCVRDISSNGFTDNQVDMLEKALADTDIYEGYVMALKGERAFAITTLNMTITGDRNLFGEKNPIRRQSLISRVGLYLVRPYIYADAMTYLKAASKNISDAAVPVMFRENRNLKEMEISPVKTLQRTILGNPLTFYSRMLLSLVSKAEQQRDVCETRILGCRTMLMIVKYKNRFGAYPESLGALKSQLKVNVPVDPMSGKDFDYKRQGGDGFFLYSIGANLRDDGGKSVVEGMRFPSVKYSDDISWKMDK